MDRKINKLIAIVVALGVVWIWTMGFFNGVTPLSNSNDMGASVSGTFEANSEDVYMQGGNAEDYASY